MAWFKILEDCPPTAVLMLLVSIYLVALALWLEDCMGGCWDILLAFWKRYFLLPLFSALSFSFSLRS
jgi:hypothetical protein